MIKQMISGTYGNDNGTVLQNFKVIFPISDASLYAWCKFMNEMGWLQNIKHFLLITINCLNSSETVLILKLVPALPPPPPPPPFLFLPGTVCWKWLHFLSFVWVNKSNLFVKVCYVYYSTTTSGLSILTSMTCSCQSTLSHGRVGPRCSGLEVSRSPFWSHQLEL